ncbi:MAG: Gfo/Idh/MocA family oxidoreductase [bacterium]|nr:Gfo/Idh/MocA family oxidoreductase [bacterium]
MIRIGIIGTGFGAKVHLPGFQTIKEAEVFGIAGSDWKKTSEIAEEKKVEIAFKSWQELIASPKIDAVSITAPPYLHFKMALTALKNGKHVLCEKQLAMNAKEARQMAELADKSRLINMVNFEFKNIPHWIYMKDLLQKNHLGRISRININWITGGRANSKLPFLWQNENKFGGGALFAYGSHMIDYIEWFFGPVEKVFGKLSILKHKVSGKTPTAEDTCDILMKLKNGALVNMITSNVIVNGCGHRIEVYGEKGSLKLRNTNLKDGIYGFELLEWLTNQNQEKIIPLPGRYSKLTETYPDGRLEAFIKIAERFIKAIKTKTPPSPSFKEGLRTQIIMDAIRKSDKLKKWIEINNPRF